MSMNFQNEQRKDACVKSYAICTTFEGTVPSYSELADVPCVSIEEVTEDLYTLVTELRESTDIAELDYDCLTAPTTPTLLNTIQLLLSEVCVLKDLVESQQESIETLDQQVSDLQANECP